MNPINNVVKMYEGVRNSSDNDANFLAIVLLSLIMEYQA